MDLDLRGTELVSLTACHSGQGEPNKGEGVTGLRAAFIVAGARSVVASMWEVPKEPTLNQAAFFYRNWLQKGMSRYAAFRAAQLSALAAARDPDQRPRNTAPHPLWWAGFTFAGDPGDLREPPIHLEAEARKQTGASNDRRSEPEGQSR
jgi:CHAT domain-containing protein